MGKNVAMDTVPAFLEFRVGNNIDTDISIKLIRGKLRISKQKMNI